VVNRRALLEIPLATLATACGSGTRQAAAQAGEGARTDTTTSAEVRNPLRVIARYTARSLGLKRPADLAIRPDGNLYITDASQRVTVVSPERKVLRRWGGAGKARGEFDFVPHDQGRPNVSAAIAVGRDGRVYVDDSGEVFAVGEDGSILRLRVSRPGA
jgi:DNA-binding beta-propeller fold protein YncE